LCRLIAAKDIHDGARGGQQFEGHKPTINQNIWLSTGATICIAKPKTLD
jgi:hypothetical protein